MRQVKRQLQRIDQAIAKAVKPAPGAELRAELEKLRNVPQEEIEQRFRLMLDESAAALAAEKSHPDYRQPTCDELSARFRELIKNS